MTGIHLTALRRPGSPIEARTTYGLPSLTVEATIATDAPTERTIAAVKAGTRYEVLSMDGVRLDETAHVKVLVDHAPVARGVAGEVVRMWREDGRIRAELRIADPDIVRQIEAGIRPNVSVGYNILEADKRGDTLYVERWEIGEVSIVAVPADKAAGIGRDRLTNPPEASNVITIHDLEADMPDEKTIADIVSRAMAERADEDSKRAAQATAATREIQELVSLSVAEAFAARDKAQAEAQAQAQAAADATKAAEDAQVAVRQRTELIFATRDLLPADADPFTLSDRQILEAAVGPDVPDAAQRSDDYLRGAVGQIVRHRTAVPQSLLDIPLVPGQTPGATMSATRGPSVFDMRRTAAAGRK